MVVCHDDSESLRFKLIKRLCPALCGRVSMWVPPLMLWIGSAEWSQPGGKMERFSALKHCV